MTFIRRNLLQLTIILGGGLLLVGSPKAASATQLPGSCSYCASACPGDLTKFCSDRHCGVMSVSCGNETGCHGTDGNWYTYTISCGS